MDKQFTASEVRRLSNRIPRSNDEIADAQEALRAFADMLETQEKAVPVAWMTPKGNYFGSWEGCTDASNGAPIPLYTHPAPSDAERLAEALRVIRQHVAKDPSALAASIIATCDSALAAHSAQAQPPAASVTDGFVVVKSDPDSAMIHAGMDWYQQDAKDQDLAAMIVCIWKAMLAAQ